MVMARRLPLQSGEPVVWFARLRLLLAGAALLSTLAFDIPHKWRAAAVIGAVAVPWAVGLLVLAVRRPESAMLAFSEVLFGVSAVCCGLFVARLRTAESAARLRARDLSRRTIEAEAQVRRRIAT
jgi:hypothetical protein